MKDDQRAALDRKRMFLVRNLAVADIPDYLFSEEVLTETDLQRINAEMIQNDKCKVLLDILKWKNPAAYDKFIGVLQKTNNGYIAEELETQRRQCLEKKETGLKDSEDIQQTLLEIFEVEQNSSVSLSEIFDNVKQTLRRKGQLQKLDEMSEDDMRNMVQEIFQNVRIEPISPRKGSSACNVRGLWLKKKACETVEDLTAKMLPESTTGKDEETGQSVFSKMDKNTLYEWMKCTLNALEIDESVADQLYEEEIDGHVFENMTVDELKDFVKKFGHRKKLLMARNKAILKKNVFVEIKDTMDTEMEHPRQFEMPSKISDKYRHGRVFQLEPRIINFLRPVRFSFLPTSTETRDILQEIAMEVTVFSSAFMNERTNGTIYVGVASSKSDNLVKGKIVGVQLSSEITADDVDKFIVSEIKKRFHEDQIQVALNCIRPPQLIGVVTEESTTDKRVVIEVDVVPNYRSTKYMTFFMKSSGSFESAGDLYRIVDGEIKSVDPRQKERFMEEKKSISARRKDIEKTSSRPRTSSNIHKRLYDFLCCGGENIEPSINPILVLGPIDEYFARDYIQENFSNLKNVPWKAIIDFGNSTEDGFLRFMESSQDKVFLRKSINDFNEKHNDEKRLNETLESIRESAIPAWIMADEDKDSRPLKAAISWKRQCKSSFTKILDFYEKEFSEERVRVAILLFSNRTDVLTEASEELFLRFPNSCLVLSESKVIIHPYISKLKSRNCADPSIIDSCCIEDLPWKIMDEVFASMCDQTPKGELKIPRTVGPPCVLPQRVLLNLCDLEIVGENECEYIHKSIPEEETEKEKQIAAESFYRGEEVKWQNFYFENQVLRRDKIDELEKMITSTLNDPATDSDEFIRRVTIYHQPGAGGTTVGRQILWNLRKTVRCCVLKKITTQTCSQICKFRNYGDTGNLKPIILLLDNHDDDKVTELYESLSEAAKECATLRDVFCVFLLCCRRPVLPFEKSTRYIMLKQQLSAREVSWLKETHKGLMTRFRANKGCNPKILISFNIMKENFSQDCIDRTLKEFIMDEQMKPNEIILIKYIAFFNTYDLKKKAIPTACFDNLFGGTRAGGKSSWEQRMSQSTRILLVYTKLQGMGGMSQGLRVVHSLLSEPLLSAILVVERERNHTQLTIGEVAMDVVSSRLFSGNMSFHKKKILTVLRTIVKKRKWIDDSLQLSFFSPLIQELLSMKDIESAVRFSIAAFEITKDSGIAQQVSRLYIDLEKWQDAEQYIQDAISLSRNNSSYWHTKGQISKKQVQALLIKYKNQNHIPNEEIENCIRLARDAMLIYQHVQELSSTENTTWRNLAGHDGEIRMVFLLLDVVQKMRVFPSRFDLNRYLSGDCGDMDIGLSDSSIRFLLGLGKRVYKVIDEFHHLILQADMKQRSFYSQTEVVSQSTGNNIENFREIFNSFFGPRGNEIVENTSDISNEQRRKEVRRFGATTLLRILQMRGKENEKLHYVLNLMTINIKNRGRSYDVNDWKVAISTILALHKRGHDNDKQKWMSLIEYSRKLYDTLPPDETKCQLVFEAHLLVSLLHWPLKSRCDDIDSLMAPFKVVEVINKWRSHVDNLPKKWKQLDKSIFYLAKGESADSVILADDLQSRAEKTSLNQGLQACIALHQFTGKLIKNGEEVIYEMNALQGKNSLSVHIKVDKPVKDSSLWQHKVSFFLGFGLHGPRAHVITNTKAENQQQRTEHREVQQTLSAGSYQGNTGNLNLPTQYYSPSVPLSPNYQIQRPYQQHYHYHYRTGSSLVTPRYQSQIYQRGPTVMFPWPNYMREHSNH